MCCRFLPFPVPALFAAVLLAGCGLSHVREAEEHRILLLKDSHRIAAVERISHRFLSPLEGKITSGFGGRQGGRHLGIDILAPKGTDVQAVDNGVVLYAGNRLRGYGNAIILDHGDGITTLYGHLTEIRVESGDAVSAGNVIGTVGNTGNATADHLHFELRVEDEAVDPKPYLGRNPKDADEP